MFNMIMLWGLMALALLIQLPTVQAQTDDIPTCPYASGVFYQPNHFPRYDFHSGRVVMVDLVTREEVRELATGISAQNYWVQSWSPECQYLSMAFSRTDERDIEYWDTLIWDVVNGGEIGRFEGARLVPFPMTWDTNSTQILVETRFGAYLWKLAGSQVWLTRDGDYNGRSFRQGTLKWDYANNQLSGVLTIPPLGSALYDMATGELLALTDLWDRPIAVDSQQALVADGDGSKYRCLNNRPDGLVVTYNVPTDRLVIQDHNTHDVVSVLEENLSDLVKTTQVYRFQWANDCRFLFVRLGHRSDSQLDFLVYDLQTNQRRLFLKDDRVRQPHIDPTGKYMVITTMAGASVYHLDTGEKFPLFAHIYSDHYNVETAFDDLIWDVENHQLQITVRQRLYGIQYIQLHDIRTGALLQSWNKQTGEPHSQVQIQAFEDQRVTPYGCSWFVEYRPHIQSIVLVHNLNRQVLGIVEDDLMIDQMTSTSRSSDCRYVIASFRVGNLYDTAVWDLETGQRTATFAGAQGMPYPLNLSPTGHYALVSTGEGAYLWHYPTDTRHQLNQAVIIRQSGRRDVVNYYQLEWVMDLGRLLIRTVDRGDVVQAFDLATGQKVGEYHPNFERKQFNFSLRPHQ